MGAQELFAATDGVYFTAATPDHGLEPWITDGTPAGTRQVADVNTATSSAPSAAIALPDGTAVLVARDDSSDTPALWLTDGSDAGTRLLSKPADPVEAFDELFAASQETLVYHAVGNSDVAGLMVVDIPSGGARRLSGPGVTRVIVLGASTSVSRIRITVQSRGSCGDVGPRSGGTITTPTASKPRNFADMGWCVRAYPSSGSRRCDGRLPRRR